MKIRYETSSLKDLKKIDRNFQKRITKKIFLLAENPFIGKKLQGEFENMRSVRVWPYRIIYRIKSSEILIYTIKHRQGVYK